MTIQNLLHLKFNSSLFRAALSNLYHPGRSYRIKFGPLRGLQLLYQPSVNYHAILGLWDSEVFELLHRLFIEKQFLPPDGVVADVGGNIGYYSLWFAKYGVTAGHVYTFEPAPEALTLLRENLRLNGTTNVEVVTSACGDHVGTAEFFLASHHHCSSLHHSWTGDQARSMRVPMTTLDAFFGSETNRRPPNVLKIDIEGGGTAALPGCYRILAEHRPFVLIESHTPEEDRAISDVLCKFEYRGYRLNDRHWVQHPQATHPDKEGVWGTLLLVPTEIEGKVSQIL